MLLKCSSLFVEYSRKKLLITYGWSHSSSYTCNLYKEKTEALITPQDLINIFVIMVAFKNLSPSDLPFRFRKDAEVGGESNTI